MFAFWSPAAFSTVALQVRRRFVCWLFLGEPSWLSIEKGQLVNECISHECIVETGIKKPNRVESQCDILNED